MDRRSNLVWLALGMLIGSVGLVVVAALVTAGSERGYAQTAGTHKPSILRALAPLRVAAAMQADGGSQKPNILFIMGDDIGWMQPSIYHRGLMVGETPNIDRIGKEGAIFMDYVAMQSCTSGRNAFSPACIRCVRG